MRQTLAHLFLRTNVMVDFIWRSFAGIGTERKQNGSNLMLTLLQMLQWSVDFSWPCIRSTMMLSLRFR
jgi:hypothetical protein